MPGGGMAKDKLLTVLLSPKSKVISSGASGCDVLFVDALKELSLNTAKSSLSSLFVVTETG